MEVANFETWVPMGEIYLCQVDKECRGYRQDCDAFEHLFIRGADKRIDWTGSPAVSLLCA
jgi:hypothetical protein